MPWLVLVPPGRLVAFVVVILIIIVASLPFPMLSEPSATLLSPVFFLVVGTLLLRRLVGFEEVLGDSGVFL